MMEGGKIVFDEMLLRAKVVYNRMTLAEFSKAIGINNATLWRKMKTGAFTRDEISKIETVLHLDSEELLHIFFAKELT